MDSTFGSRYESPYRPAGALPPRHTVNGQLPSVGGTSRYESPYGRDRPEIGSSPDRYEGGRRQMINPNFSSEGSVAETVATNVLNGRIDKVLAGNSNRLSDPISSNRHSLAPIMSGRDNDHKNYSEVNSSYGSSRLHRTKEVSELMSHTRGLSEPRRRPRDFTEPGSRTRDFSEPRSCLRDLSDSWGRSRDLSEPRFNVGRREYGRSRSPPFDKLREFSRYSGCDYRLRDPDLRSGRDFGRCNYNWRRGGLSYERSYDRPSEYGSRFVTPTRELYGRRDEAHSVRSSQRTQYERSFNDRRIYGGRGEYDDDFRRKGDYNDMSRRYGNRCRGTDYHERGIGERDYAEPPTRYAREERSPIEPSLALPPRTPSALHVQNNYTQTRGAPSAPSDLSSVTGTLLAMPKSIGMVS